ncbi:MAG: hypothetical protein CL916_00790 [Deltaproteobacteria bacterium]|nr:hypothetical protein [Deltaproteobacteria bacterium]
MSWDRSWAFEKKSVLISDVEENARSILKEYNDITVVVEQEASDCITCFFTVPSGAEAHTVEISVYHMGGKSYVVSLEADAADNENQALADTLAEDLAEAFGGEPLEE